MQLMLPLVSAQRREQALRYKHIFGQYCCLKSWLMLKELIGEDKKEWMEQWEYNEHGRPYWVEGPYFSISHCKEGIAVAIDNQPIGIDIEAIRHADTDLIIRTMNETEQQQIHSDRDFTRLWTQKEAVAKMNGTGIEGFEQLQNILTGVSVKIETAENSKYIYSIAYKQH